MDQISNWPDIRLISGKISGRIPKIPIKIYNIWTVGCQISSKISSQPDIGNIWKWCMAGYHILDKKPDAKFHIRLDTGYLTKLYPVEYWRTEQISSRIPYIWPYTSNRPALISTSQNIRFLFLIRIILPPWIRILVGVQIILGIVQILFKINISYVPK